MLGVTASGPKSSNYYFFAMDILEFQVFFYTEDGMRLQSYASTPNSICPQGIEYRVTQFLNCAAVNPTKLVSNFSTV